MSILTDHCSAWGLSIKQWESAWVIANGLSSEMYSFAPFMRLMEKVHV